MQMEEYLLESKMKKMQLEQDQARLELQQRKEKLRLEVELLKIQEEEKNYISRQLTSKYTENMQIYSDVGKTQTRPDNILLSKRVSRSLPILTEQEFEGNKKFTKPSVQKEQVNSKVFASNDNDEIDTQAVSKLSISPRQPPEPKDRLTDNRENFNYTSKLSNQHDFADPVNTLGIQFAQSTPKAENESTKRGTTTPKVSEDSPPFNATRRESTKNTERNFTDETTLHYESPDKGSIQPTATGLQQQQQSLPIQELLEQQRQHTNALTLPQTELPVFTGDPIEYILRIY
ncbi:MAG: hypothetical protein DSY43_01935 [Gammaproteobacteria bacterium]|nr:MAG: hypothetical protein DSY43_01935 [Gammaproteobacteria bacterium]